MTLSLPSLVADQVRLRNAVARVECDLPVVLAGVARHLTFLPGELPLEESPVRLSLIFDGHPVELRFSANLEAPGQLQEMGVLDYDSLPARLKHLLVVRSLDRDLDALEAWSARSVRVGTGERIEGEVVTVSFRLSDDIRGDLVAGAAAMPLLVELLEKLPVKVLDLGDQPVRLGIEAGRTTLSVSEVESLERGDVILIDRGPDLRNGAVEIRPSPGLLFRATHSETELTIEEIMSKNENDAIDPGSDEVASVGDLPVVLVFELGSQQVTLSELHALQPGSTIPLGQPLEDAEVTVRANGKAFAKGQLVEVAGKIGVRIK